MQAGCGMIELDVTITKDRRIVVIHDDTLDRTTNGSGRVSDTSFPALRALDAGAWFDPAFAGERVPLLSKVLDAVGGRLRVNIEIKGWSLRGETYRGATIETEVASLVRERGLSDSVIVSSFNPSALARMRRVAPELQRALLFAGRASGPLGPALVIGLWARALARAHALHPRAAAIDARWVKRMRARGFRVNVWTVDEPEEMRRMISAGVDGIITDYPGRLRAILDRRVDGGGVTPR